MKRFYILACFLISAISVYSQNTFYVALNDGLWNDPATWSTTFNGAGGAGVPTAADYVRTNGRRVIVDSDVTVRRLFVNANTANSIRYDADNGLDPYTITITELMVGSSGDFTSGNGSNTKPTTTVIELNQDLRFRFTGANSTNVLRSWSYLAPLPYVTIDAPGLTINTQDNTGGVTGGEFRVRYNLTIANGTFQPMENVGDYVGSALLTVANGATLDLSLASINGDGTNTTRFNSATIAGTTTISGTQYLNINSLTLQSSGSLNVNCSGPNQTAGWWFQSTAPTGTVTLTGPVTYGASAAQAIATIAPYANLTLSGSGFTKTASPGGSFQINGVLTIGSSVTLVTSAASSVILRGNVINDGSWSPTQVVRFEGTTPQSLSGNVVAFGGGVDVGNAGTTPTTTVNVADNLDINGALRIFTNSTLNLGDNQLNLSGNLSNSGQLLNDGMGVATIVFDGTTSVSGTASNSFPNVTIAGTFNAPATLTITGALTINSGAYNAGTTLNLAGNFSRNAGTFNANSGTVVFNGTSGQSLNGIATFNNMTISNPNTLTASGTTTLTGTLSLSGAGKFNSPAAANFIIASTDLNSGGRIAALSTPGNFTGFVTVQRFIAAPEDYKYISVPVIGANVGMLQADIGVTGNFSNPTTPAQNPNVINQTAASLFTFNGATQSFTAVGSGAATGSTSLSNNTAYVAWTYLSSDAVVEYTGAIGKSSVPLLGLAANQYNLIPNPYPSAIDWDQITTTGFSNSMYMTTSQGNFATYTKGAGIGINHPNDDWTGQIALGQSFYVQSTGGTSLTLTESAKTATYDFVRESEAIDYFKIKLTGLNEDDIAVSDELAIAFRDGATTSIDEIFDARKKVNPTIPVVLPNLSSFINSSSEDLAINVLPKIQCNQVVKLKMNQVATGEHTLSFSHLNKLMLGYKIVLKDNLTGIEKNVTEGVSHTFTVDASEPATLADGRFELRIGSPIVDPTFNFGLSSSYDCNDDFVKVNFENSQLGVKYLFKLGDENLHEPVQAQGSNDVVLIPKSRLQYGANSLTLVASSVDACNAYIYNQAVIVNFFELNQISSVVSANLCEKGAATLTAQGALSNGSYRWYETENSVEPISGESEASFTTPVLDATKTYYVAAVNSNGCESPTRMAVTATIGSKSEISSVVPASVCGEGKLTLQASGAPANGSYRWYESQEGGNAIPDAIGARFTTPVLNETKTYYVSAISATGCESNVRVPVTATVNTLATPQIIANGFEATVVADDNQVQWFKDGVEIDGATESSYSIRESGVYTVKLSSANGCSTTSAGMEFIVLGAEENYSNHGFKVYPNPTEGLLTIEGSEIGSSDIGLWDLNGKALDGSVITRKSPSSVVADITRYPKGTYVINIKKNNIVVQFKAIKK